MDGTQDDTKPLTRRLTDAQQLLVVVGMAGILLLAVGVGIAAQGDSVLLNDTHSQEITDVKLGPGDDHLWITSADDSISKLDLSDNDTEWNVSTGGGNHRKLHVDSGENSYFTDGDKLWKYNTSGGVENSFNVVNPDGVGLSDDQNRVFVGTSGGDLYALDTTDFSTEWSITELDSSSNSIESLVGDSDGNVYVGRFTNAKIHKVTSTGTLDWTKTLTENAAIAEISPDEDTVYFAHGTGPFAVDAMHAANGTEIWSNDNFSSQNGGDINDVTAGPGGDYVYLATQNNSRVYALHASNGTEAWNVSMPSDAEAIDVNAQGGTGYVGADNSGVYRLDLGAPTNLTTGIYGDVVDGDSNDLSGVTINATDSNGNSKETTTNNLGKYSLDLENGTYTVEATKTGYLSEEETGVVVSGNRTRVDFTLFESNSTLLLEVDRRYLRHNATTGYTVIDTNRTGGTVNRTDVTDSATVTSNNTSILTVDTSANELVATGDRSVNDVALVTASYNGKTDTETVTVANVTIDHIAILPPWARFEATITPGTEANPNDHSFMLIMIATMVAVAGTLLMSVFVGLGAFSMIIMAGWLIGLTTTGLMLVVLTVVGFAGLNLAANIDYAVT